MSRKTDLFEYLFYSKKPIYNKYIKPIQIKSNRNKSTEIQRRKVDNSHPSQIKRMTEEVKLHLKRDFEIKSVKNFKTPVKVHTKTQTEQISSVKKVPSLSFHSLKIQKSQSKPETSSKRDSKKEIYSPYLLSNNKTEEELIDLKIKTEERISDSRYKLEQLNSEMNTNEKIRHISKLNSEINKLKIIKEQCLETYNKLIEEISLIYK